MSSTTPATGASGLNDGPNTGHVAPAHLGTAHIDTTHVGTAHVDTTPDTRTARSTGLAVAAAGIVVFNVAPYMNWLDPRGEGVTRTGYEADSLVPFIAYLGIGLLVALAYARSRARRGQHRGLTLVSMATGIAATIWSIAYAVSPMGALERGDSLDAQVGIYVAILGAALWALGSGLLAKEIEGDDADRVGTRSAGAR